ncbi:MAG: hypothetical protein HC872_07235 [Gammaproteobacteria bacterium]|nr:hypothetical protein [Gammaproteobacteria bacterium]
MESRNRFARGPRVAVHRFNSSWQARQGKSFILNQLLGRSTGFVVAPTHRPCTKGLWMWSAPIERTAADGSKHYWCVLNYVTRLSTADGYRQHVCDSIEALNCDCRSNDVSCLGCTYDSLVGHGANICLGVTQFKHGRLCAQAISQKRDLHCRSC